MGTCEICGKTKDETNNFTIYTARSLGQAREKTGFKTHTVTTSFGDFKEHTYEVCNSCNIRRTCLIPLIVYLISAVLLALVFGIRNSTSFWNAMLYVGGALFVAFGPAGLVLANTRVEEKLLRNAIAYRKASNPGEKIKGYTSQAYQTIKKTRRL